MSVMRTEKNRQWKAIDSPLIINLFDVKHFRISPARKSYTHPTVYLPVFLPSFNFNPIKMTLN